MLANLNVLSIESSYEGCGSLSRSTVDLQATRRQENHNRVIQPPTGSRPQALPQLSSTFDRPYFRGK